jgi:hypothetical protein
MIGMWLKIFGFILFIMSYCTVAIRLIAADDGGLFEWKKLLGVLMLAAAYASEIFYLERFQP